VTSVVEARRWGVGYLRMFFPHSLRAIRHGSSRVGGLSTRIRGLQARVAGDQHADAQTEDTRCNDRHHDGCRTIEEEESEQGPDHGTGDRAYGSPEEQPAAKPQMHPGLGRAFELIPALAPRASVPFLHEGVVPVGLDSNLALHVPEYSMQIGIRPLLMPSRLEDTVQKIMRGDEHWARLSGAGAVAEIADDNLYLAMSVRNAGSGVAVIHGWHLVLQELHQDHPHAEPDEFRRQIRDLYVPGDDVGFWQGARSGASLWPR
jgi:hypothetical protein